MAGGDSTGPTAPKQVTKPSGQKHSFALKRILLKVSVRTDFLVRAPFLVNAGAPGGVEFHWDGGEAVKDLTVALPGAPSIKTDSSGIAKVDITNIADGSYDLALSMDSPAQASVTQPAGPQLARNLPSPPARIYRPLTINITLAGGKLTAAKDPYDPDSGMTWGRIGNRNQKQWSADHLPIDYRPVWMTSPRERTLRKAADVNLIICHCTGGGKIGSAINTFKSAPGKDSDSAHYLIDHDGHIIKFCREDHLVDHAGITVVWGGLRSVNPVSIGIEMVHHSKDKDHPEPEIEYNAHQITALAGLLQGLQGDSTMTIPTHRIVGHSDVDFVHNKDGSLGSRDTDPGQKFQWENIEAAGLGMIPQADADMSKAYGGFFTQSPTGSLRDGDNDAKKIWGGGKPQKSYDAKTGHGMPIPDSNPPVKELQDDLNHIGYTTTGAGSDVSNTPGEFGDYTAFQVRKFQWHFFSFNRKRKATGMVDLETAKMIKRVAAAIP